jgi:hypothetical protein
MLTEATVIGRKCSPVNVFAWHNTCKRYLAGANTPDLAFVQVVQPSVRELCLARVIGP